MDTTERRIDLAACRQQLAGFLDLEDDWDGYGAMPIEPSCVAAAEVVLVVLVSAAPDLRAPHIGPLVIGGVGLEWDVGDDWLSIDFEPSDTPPFVDVTVGGNLGGAEIDDSPAAESHALERLLAAPSMRTAEPG